MSIVSDSEPEVDTHKGVLRRAAPPPDVLGARVKRRVAGNAGAAADSGVHSDGDSSGGEDDDLALNDALDKSSVAGSTYSHQGGSSRQSSGGGSRRRYRASRDGSRHRRSIHSDSGDEHRREGAREGSRGGRDRRHKRSRHDRHDRHDRRRGGGRRSSSISSDGGSGSGGSHRGDSLTEGGSDRDSEAELESVASVSTVHSVAHPMHMPRAAGGMALLSPPAGLRGQKRKVSGLDGGDDSESAVEEADDRDRFGSLSELPRLRPMKHKKPLRTATPPERLREMQLSVRQAWAGRITTRCPSCLLLPDGENPDWQEYSVAFYGLLTKGSQLSMEALGAHLCVVWEAFSHHMEQPVPGLTAATAMYGLTVADIDMDQVMTLWQMAVVLFNKLLVRVESELKSVEDHGEQELARQTTLATYRDYTQAMHSWAQASRAVLDAEYRLRLAKAHQYDPNMLIQETTLLQAPYSAPATQKTAEKVGVVKLGLAMHDRAYRLAGGTVYEPVFDDQRRFCFAYRPVGPLAEVISGMLDPAVTQTFWEVPLNRSFVETVFAPGQSEFLPRLRSTGGTYGFLNCIMDLRESTGMRLYLKFAGEAESALLQAATEACHRLRASLKQLDAARHRAKATGAAVADREEIGRAIQYLKVFRAQFKQMVHPSTAFFEESRYVCQNYIEQNVDLVWARRLFEFRTEEVWLAGVRVDMPVMDIPQVTALQSVFEKQGLSKGEQFFIGMMLARAAVPRTAGVDKWIGSLIFEGVTGTGKSTLLDVMRAILGPGFAVELAARTEGAFALGSTVDENTMLVFCYEMTAELLRTFGKAALLQLLGGEAMSLAQKYDKTEQSRVFNFLGASNDVQDESVTGEFGRRQFIASLFAALMDGERNPLVKAQLMANLGNLLFSWGCMYRVATAQWGDCDLWDIAPKSFGDKRKEKDDVSSPVKQWCRKTASQVFYLEAGATNSSSLWCLEETVINAVRETGGSAVHSLAKGAIRSALVETGYYACKATDARAACVRSGDAVGETVFLGIGSKNAYPRVVEAMLSDDSLVAPDSMPLRISQRMASNITTWEAVPFETVLYIVKQVATASGCVPLPSDNPQVKYVWLRKFLEVRGCKIVQSDSELCTLNEDFKAQAAQLQAQQQPVPAEWVLGLVADFSCMDNAVFDAPVSNAASTVPGGFVSPGLHAGGRGSVASPPSVRRSATVATPFSSRHMSPAFATPSTSVRQGAWSAAAGSRATGGMTAGTAFGAGQKHYPRGPSGVAAGAAQG